LDKKPSFSQIGNIIRKYRKEKGLKLIDLASSSGISVAMLSKIENGRMVPTIPTLFSAISTLRIPVDTFFKQVGQTDAFPGYYFVPKKDYTRFVKEEKAKGFEYYSILEHSFESTSVQIALLHLAPNSKRKAVRTAAYEYIYMVSGSVQYSLGKNTFCLKTGDSLFFDGAIPHVPVNAGKTTAILLVAYLFTASR
jgi:transcriptional regulator with XRE-family HTH domain